MAIVKHSAATNDIVQGETTITFQPYQGYVEATSYEGGEQAVRNQFSALTLDNWRCSMIIRTSGTGENRASLQAEKVLDTIITPVWEKRTIPIERNLIECTELPFVAECSPETRANIEYRIKNPNSRKPLAVDFTNPDEPDNAETTLALMQSGYEAKLLETPEFTRTIVVPNTYNVTWTLDWVGFLCSKQFLINYFDVPEYMWNILPNTSTAIETDSKGLTRFFGYYIHDIDYVTSTNNKVTVSQKFSYNRWSCLPSGLYPIVGQ